MPELPEVESVARALRAALLGRRLTGLRARFAGSFEPSPAAVRRAAVGLTLDRVHRRGKYLVLTFGADTPRPAHLMLHLRMTGQLLFEPADRADRHVRAVLDFEGRSVRYRDVRKFGRWTLVDDGENPSAIAHIGTDMLEIRFREWSARVRGRRAPFKSVLLDQGVASGIGNIYADETLFRARIHPLRRPADCTDDELRRVFDAARGVLRLAIDHGGTTFLDFRNFHGKPGNFRRKLRVFQRDGEPCGRCRTPLVRITVGGRGTHFCPTCQPEEAPAAAARRGRTRRSTA